MYTIGQFSLILKVSTRTLRHYDDFGLLKPYYIDEESNYRYYSKEQTVKAKKIIRMKESGLSLEEIKEIITDSDVNVKEIIEKRLRTIEEEISGLIKMKESLKGMLNEEADYMADNRTCKTYDIKTVKLDDVNVISKRCKTDIRNIGAVVGELFEKINKNGLRVKGGHIIKYYGNEYDPENADIEVCVPVESRKECRIKFNSIPGGRFVTADAHSVSEKGDVHANILNWAKANNYEVEENPYEQYTVDYQKGLFKVDIYYRIK